jgi:hypothetical protein
MSTNRRNLAKSMAVRVRLACGIARSLITAICTLGAVCTTSAAGPLPWSSGSTTFQLTPGAPPSGNPTPVAVGDLNGDGHADLVTLMVPRPQRYVVVRRMDAAGLPAAPQLFPEPVFSDYPLPGALTIADLDGDGHADLVSPLWYMPGNGDGTLGAAQFLPRYQDVHLDVPPAVADMDGDGKADLVMASTSGYFEVFRGLGGGILDSLNAYLSRTNVPGSVQHLAVADLNHDSHPDVITSGAAGGTNVFLSNGDGTFASAVSVNAANGSIGIADLNGDGHPDLVVGTAVALGDGAGHFSAGTPLPLPALVIGDFDGDGRTDVVLADSSSVLVMRGDGAGQFSSWKRLTTGPSPFEAHATDFNLDARLDLVVLNTCGAPAQVFMNGPVGFVVPPSYPVGRAPVALAKLDANGDGTPDLVVGSRGSRTISMLLGTGGGNFTAVASAEVAAGLVALRVADLFGDGRHEIVVACDTSNSVSVIPVTTAGGFGTRVDLPAGAGPVDLDVGDLDHDGRQEAVVLSADHTMTEISADGLGNLSSHAFAASPSPTHGVSGVALADWSGDGNLDAGVSELGGASATDNGQDEIFFGDGLGNLVSGFWTDGHTAALAFSDLDQDGHPDLVRVFAWDS